MTQTFTHLQNKTQNVRISPPQAKLVLDIIFKYSQISFFRPWLFNRYHLLQSTCFLKIRLFGIEPILETNVTSFPLLLSSLNSLVPCGSGEGVSTNLQVKNTVTEGKTIFPAIPWAACGGKGIWNRFIDNELVFRTLKCLFFVLFCNSSCCHCCFKIPVVQRELWQNETQSLDPALRKHSKNLFVWHPCTQSTLVPVCFGIQDSQVLC